MAPPQRKRGRTQAAGSPAPSVAGDAPVGRRRNPARGQGGGQNDAAEAGPSTPRPLVTARRTRGDAEGRQQEETRARPRREAAAAAMERINRRPITRRNATVADVSSSSSDSEPDGEISLPPETINRLERELREYNDFVAGVRAEPPTLEREQPQLIEMEVERRDEDSGPRLLDLDALNRAMGLMRETEIRRVTAPASQISVQIRDAVMQAWILPLHPLHSQTANQIGTSECPWSPFSRPAPPSPRTTPPPSPFSTPHCRRGLVDPRTTDAENGLLGEGARRGGEESFRRLQTLNTATARMRNLRNNLSHVQSEIEDMDVRQRGEGAEVTVPARVFMERLRAELSAIQRVESGLASVSAAVNAIRRPARNANRSVWAVAVERSIHDEIYPEGPGSIFSHIDHSNQPLSLFDYVRLTGDGHLFPTPEGESEEEYQRSRFMVARRALSMWADRRISELGSDSRMIRSNYTALAGEVHTADITNDMLSGQRLTELMGRLRDGFGRGRELDEEETKQREKEDEEEKLETAIRSTAWGDCTICFDVPTNPVGCEGCKQLIGCKKCADRWFRAGKKPVFNGQAAVAESFMQAMTGVAEQVSRFFATPNIARQLNTTREGRVDIRVEQYSHRPALLLPSDTDTSSNRSPEAWNGQPTLEELRSTDSIFPHPPTRSPSDLDGTTARTRILPTRGQGSRRSGDSLSSTSFRDETRESEVQVDREVSDDSHGAPIYHPQPESMDALVREAVPRRREVPSTSTRFPPNTAVVELMNSNDVARDAHALIHQGPGQGVQIHTMEVRLDRGTPLAYEADCPLCRAKWRDHPRVKPMAELRTEDGVAVQ